MRRATGAVDTVLLNRVESAQTGVTCRCENDIGALVDLRERDLFSLARIVPGGIGYADVILNHLNIRINRLRALFESTFETVNQTDIHPADESQGVRLRGLGRKYSDQVRTLMFFEDERGNIRSRCLAIIFENHAIDDRKVN